MRLCRTEPTRVLLAIVLSATAACQADSVSAPPVRLEPKVAANVVGAATEPPTVTLQVGDSTQLTHPFQASLVSIPGMSLTWEASDSSVVEIDATGIARALSPGDATVGATLCTRPLSGIGGRKRGQARQCQTYATVVRVEPVPVVDTSAAPSLAYPQGEIPKGVEGVKWLAGPIPPLSTGRSSGWVIGKLTDQEIDKYERSFGKYADQHWKSHGANWEMANYYDRAAIYYVWWARTGNEEYLRRANAIALDYRTKFLESQAMPYTYNASTYWHMPMGLALHYLATGDEKSRQAVGYSAEWVGALHMVQELDKVTTMARPGTYIQSPAASTIPATITVGTAENRWRARVLQAFVLSHAINAPQNGPALGYGQGGMVGAVPGTWAQKAKVVLDKILAVQNADGSYRDITSGGAEKPFMDGLLNDALILYYQFVAQDPRILSAVKRNIDYNWANVWLGHRENSQSFAYYEWSYTAPEDPNWSGGRYAAGDLNLMMVNAFGWVYSMTGDVAYRDRGNQIFKGGIDLGYVEGSKQFNQMYHGSWRFIAYRVARPFVASHVAGR